MTLPAHGRYHGLPLIQSLPGRKSYMIRQSPHEWFGYQRRDGIWIIPDNGEYTDQGSVPSPFTPWVPRDAYLAFYIHDPIYRHHSYQVYATMPDGLPDLRRKLGRVPVTRKFGDDTLWEAMRTENVVWNNGNKVEAALVYAGVVIGAGPAWSKGGRRRDDLI